MKSIFSLLLVTALSFTGACATVQDTAARYEPLADAAGEPETEVVAFATAPAAVEMSREVAALNSAGDHVYASVGIRDDTGVVTTVAAAGTYVTVGTAAPLVAGEADGSGCITYTLASNKFTIAKRCGQGELVLEACLNDLIGTNAKFALGAWHRVRAGATVVVGPITRRSEPATAVRGTQGCVRTVVDALESDTYDFRFDAETNGNTVTTRDANFLVMKILNK